METNQKTILVYDDFSSDRPVLMGCLYVNVLKGGESYSFEYDKEWLKKTGLALILDPERPIPADSIRAARIFLACLLMLLLTAGAACL